MILAREKMRVGEGASEQRKAVQLPPRTASQPASQPASACVLTCVGHGQAAAEHVGAAIRGAVPHAARVLILPRRHGAGEAGAVLVQAPLAVAVQAGAGLALGAHPADLHDVLVPQVPAAGRVTMGAGEGVRQAWPGGRGADGATGCWQYPPSSNSSGAPQQQCGAHGRQPTARGRRGGRGAGPWGRPRQTGPGSGTCTAPPAAPAATPRS